MAENPSARRSLARKGNAKAIPADEAKARVKQLIAEGHSVKEACAAVGRAEATYFDWRKNDKAYAAEIDALRSARAKAEDIGVQPVPDFPTFCREWLHQPLFRHQYHMLDAIEGNAPRGLHSSVVYEQGDPTRVLVNVPPSHGKTTTFSINYVVWRIHKDPNVKVIIVSKSQTKAKQILGAIKHKLVSPLYRDMHMRFAPNGGWKDPDNSWTQTEIYVQGKDDGAKDPTVEALGINGQIYGARADLIILDDSVTLGNVTAHESQLAWLRQEVDSRLPPDGGLLAILGTRVAPIDLYKQVREIEDLDGGQYFTYLALPAVFDYADGNRENWVTLWPREMCEPGHKYRDGDVCLTCYSSDPCDHPDDRVAAMDRWNGPRLAKKRAAVGERTWALVYQQADVSDDAVFPQRAIEASINGNRLPGVMHEGVPGVRPGGMQGLYVVGGLDPATTGATAMQVWGIDRVTQRRYVLDGFNKTECRPQEMRDVVKRLTLTHGINEWVIERNAFQRFLTQDPELREFLYGRGCRLTEHHTGSEKLDPDFGVMSMAPLFLSCGDPQAGDRGGKWSKTPDRALIELPATHQNAWIQEFVAQLIVWQPQGMRQKQKTDLVMAAWFCEIAAKKILGIGRRKLTHLNNTYASRGRLADRTVISLADAREELIAGRRAV